MCIVFYKLKVIFLTDSIFKFKNLIQGIFHCI